MQFSFKISVALVLLLTLVGAHAVPNTKSASVDAVPADIANGPASAGDSTYYCGYLYKEKGLRGSSINLLADIGKAKIIHGPGHSVL
jgi:hypothetical protein